MLLSYQPARLRKVKIADSINQIMDTNAVLQVVIMESSRKLADRSFSKGVLCVAVPQVIGVISLFKSNKIDYVVENVRQASLTRRVGCRIILPYALHSSCTSGSQLT
jgi:hypothetical protein